MPKKITKSKKVNKKTAKNKKLIVANWKMNPENLHDARKIFSELKKKKIKFQKTTAVICPPSIFLGDLSNNYDGNRFLFGAQDISVRNENESTGEISASILANFGVKFAIIGHSERRSIGETDVMVSLKIKNAIDFGITPILCVGENDRDIDGKYLRFIENQLRQSLVGIEKKEISKIVIAYEPVWAIGKGHQSMSGYELHQMNLFIKKVLADIYDRKIAMKIPIIYGGSVDRENVSEIIETGEVDGLLIGRASLNPYVFIDILEDVEKM